jgi:hypothetical protein
MRHTDRDLQELGQELAYAEFWSGVPVDVPTADLVLDAKQREQVAQGYRQRLEVLRGVAPAWIGDPSIPNHLK